jgi:hypothetical protein
MADFYTDFLGNIHNRYPLYFLADCTVSHNGKKEDYSCIFSLYPKKAGKSSNIIIHRKQNTENVSPQETLAVGQFPKLGYIGFQRRDSSGGRRDVPKALTKRRSRV